MKLSTSLHGYLLASEERKPISKEGLMGASDEEVPTITLGVCSPLFGLKNWSIHAYKTTLQLDPDAGPKDEHGQYTYPIVSGFSGPKIIILAARRNIAEHVITEVLDNLIFPNLRRVNFYIPELVKICETRETAYLVTSLYGRFRASGRDLRSVSLYGDDITESEIYRLHADRFNFFSCGLGKKGKKYKNTEPESEIIRLGDMGFISAYLTNRDKVQELATALNFLIEQGLVDQWVPQEPIVDE